MTRGGKISRKSPAVLRHLALKIFQSLLDLRAHQRDLQGKAMAEIHDQFDTILILDFGSQVRSQLALVPKDLMKDSTQQLVQPSDHKTVS